MSLDKDTQGSSVYGTELQTAQDSATSVTTSTLFQNKLSLSTTNLPAWLYQISVSYGRNHDANNSDFEARVQLDSVNIWEIHKQEPKDSAWGWPTWSTQRIPLTRLFEPQNLSWIHTIDLEYRTDTLGVESSIRDTYIKLFRLS